MTEFEKLVLMGLDILMRTQIAPSWREDAAAFDAHIQKLMEDRREWDARRWVAIADRDEDKSPDT